MKPLLPEEDAEHSLAGHGHGDSTLLAFEHGWKAFIDFGLFAFGLANAGVAFASINNVTWIIFSALLIGKTFGIFLLGYIAQIIGFPLPDGMSNKELLMAGLVAALGLTVALFVAGVAFTDPVIQGAAKMGALFSAFVFILAPVVAKMLRIRKVSADHSSQEL
jgi:NhaA family Na+:H+ antiporter